MALRIGFNVLRRQVVNSRLSNNYGGMSQNVRINGACTDLTVNNSLEIRRHQDRRWSCTLSHNKISFITSSSVETQARSYGSIYEPDYLDSTGPEIPTYDVLNIQIKGFDFPILEKFAKHVHNAAERIGLSVEDAWATPSKRLRVTKYKPESTALETEYALNIYERNVQIADVPATLLPVFLNVIEASIPTGVTLRVHPHLPEHSEVRYVPDLQLKELKTQLDAMRGEKK